MKLLQKTKYTTVWIILWFSLIWFTSYAAVTWAWTLWSLFLDIWAWVYKLMWDEIQDNTIDSSEIQNNSLTASDLAPDSVWNSELANNSVNSANIINNTITTSDILNWTILSIDLADDYAVSKNFNVRFYVRPEDLISTWNNYSYLNWWETYGRKVTEKSSITLSVYSNLWGPCNKWTIDSEEQWVQNFDLLNNTPISELTTLLGSSRDSVGELFREICDDKDGCMIRNGSKKTQTAVNSGWVWNTFAYLKKWNRSDWWNFYSVRTDFGTHAHFPIDNLNTSWGYNGYVSQDLWFSFFYFVNQRWPYTGAAISNSLYLHTNSGMDICYDTDITFID